MQGGQPQIELSQTVAIKTPENGDIFQQGFVMRKVSRFITQGAEDAVMPIPVFYCPETGKILGDTLPPEIRGEYDSI